MEARAGSVGRAIERRPSWLLGLVPLALLAGVALIFALLDGPGLGDRTGPPVEELAIERTEMRPGEIELTVRNDGPDAVRIAQVIVNDGFVGYEPAGAEIGRLDSETIEVTYPWIEGEAYEIALLTSTGGTIDHEIAVAAETPDADLGFYGLMALLGIYVGVIPVSLGMLWLPFVRRVSDRWLQALLAFTVGLLAFLGIDATIEGIELAGEGAQAFGGTGLVFLGAAVAFLLLSAVDAHLGARRTGTGAVAGASLALLIAVGIGLHNLGEGLAIGSAYASGALALGAFLVIGFALHNTTEGLAIVAPMSRGAARPGLARLAVLGLVAGAPAILGTWVGASAFNPSAAAFLLGAGAGAIAQVIVQLVPTMRDGSGRALNPLSVGAMLAGLAVLYATSLLVSI